MSVNEDEDAMRTASNTEFENNIETAQECRKRICSPDSPDPAWNKRLKMTKTILASKRRNESQIYEKA